MSATQTRWTPLTPGEPPTSPQARGRHPCPACGRLCAVAASGEIYVHDATLDGLRRLCPGSHSRIPDDEQPVGAVDLVRRSGLTYRQINYAVSQGLIHPLPRARTDSGHPIRFTPDEAAVVTTAGALVHAGLRPDAALHTARALHRDGHADLAGWRLSKTPSTDQTGAST